MRECGWKWGFASPWTREHTVLGKRLSIITRKGEYKGKKKRGIRVSIKGGKEKYKRGWENREGEGNSGRRKWSQHSFTIFCKHPLSKHQHVT